MKQLIKKITILTFLVLVATTIKSSPCFAATKTFDGNDGTDSVWGTDANWDPEDVPGTADDVIIAYNCNLDRDRTVASLTINNGSTLNTTTSNYNLTVNGDVDIDGALTANAATIQFSDNWDATGGTFNAGTSIVRWNVSAQSVSKNITSGGSNFYNFRVYLCQHSSKLIMQDDLIIDNDLTIDGPTCYHSALDTNSSENYTLTVNGDVYMGGTGTYQVNLYANNSNVYFKGNFTGNNSKWSVSGGTVTFCATSGTKTITSAGGSLSDLIFNEGGEGVTWQLGDALIAKGSITITSGTLDVTTGKYQITFGGNWDTSAVAGSFNARQGTVKWDSSTTIGDKNITSGGKAFYNFWTYKGNGSGYNYLVMQDALTITNNLTMSAPSNYHGLDTNSTYNYTLTVDGDVSMSDVTRIVGNSSNIYFKGNFTATSVHAEIISGTVTFCATSGTKTIDSQSQVPNVIFDGGEGVTWELGNNLDVNGDLTITSGTLDVTTINYQINFAGAWDSSAAAGSFNARQGTVVYDLRATTTKNITTGGKTFYNFKLYKGGSWATLLMQDALAINNDLTIDATTGWVKLDTNSTGNYSLTVGGDLTIGNTSTEDYLIGNSSAITVGGSWSNTNTWGGFIHSGTVTFNSSSTATMDTGGPCERPNYHDFQNLVIDKSGGSLTLENNNLDVDGNLTVTAGSLVLGSTATSLSATVGGNLSNSGTIEIPGVGTNLSLTGTWTNNSNSLVKYLGTDADDGVTVQAETYYNLEVDNADTAFNQGGTTIINNNLDITNGTYDISGGNITVTGILSNDDNFQLQGGETLTLTSDTDTGTVTYDGTTSYTGLKYGDTYNNLTFDGSGDWTLDNALDVDGNLTITNGTLDASNQNVTTDGNVSLAAASYTKGNGTFTLSDNAANGTQTIDFGGNNIEDLVINANGDTKQLTGNVTTDSLVMTVGTFDVDSALDINGIFTLNNGTLDLSTNPNVNISGDITLNAGNITAGTGNITFDGDLTYTDNVGLNLGNIFIGTSPDTTNLAANLNCNALTVNLGDVLNTNGYNIDCANNITVIGTLNAANGVGGNTTINLTGHWNTSGTFTNTNSTIILDGNTAQNITSGGQAFNNLTLNNTGVAPNDDIILQDALDVDDDLIITDGDLNGNNFNITIGGDWDNSAETGSYTAGTETVTFDTAGTTTISGDSTFYGLACITPSKRIDVAAASTQTVTNTLNLDGQAAGTEIDLNSDTPGTQWNINTTGATATADFVDVQDSNSTVMIGATNSIDSGNNVNWFVVAAATTTPSPRGGGSMPPRKPKPSLENPEGEFKVVINPIAARTGKLISSKYTENRKVSLRLFAGEFARRMSISSNKDKEGKRIPYQSRYTYDLCQGQTSCPEGEYTIYVRFYTKYARSSDIISESIVLREKKPIIEQIPERIKEIFIPREEKEEPLEFPPLEEVVTRQPPLSMQGKWQLLVSEPIREFVLAPLPREIRALTEKFPELRATFEQVGITKITDIGRLRTVKLTLPGLTEALGLPSRKVEPGKLALPKGIPVAELSPEVKEKLPSEIVFAKTGGQLIDFDIALTVTEKGKPEQRIATISGKPLQLVVKPDKPVKSVKGYVVFKSRITNQESRIKNCESITMIPDSRFLIQDLAASLIFANPVFAQPQEKPVRVEERLVLLEFEYTDPDGDGIYMAEIQAPLVEGEYEIITVMDYEDPELGKKEIRLITVVDPEGYVYTQLREGKLRVAGAIVSLFWLNQETKQYELWPAEEYQQENPQITDDTGRYSFLVPEGSYHLKVEAPGYLIYQTDPFSVKEGSGIHINIELKKRFWWLRIFDWKIIVMILMFILLLYNFYRDKMRERSKKREL